MVKTPPFRELKPPENWQEQKFKANLLADNLQNILNGHSLPLILG